MNVITNKSDGLKCLTEIKIQTLYDHVNHKRFNSVKMECQKIQLVLSTNIVGPTMFVYLTPALRYNFLRKVEATNTHFKNKQKNRNSYMY